ncbi:MAG: asparaginase [Microscillaceae bacterium]|nr:asparaginase [Microscillaceae bacterium]
MKITFLQTGGTIDKDYPKTQKGWAFEIGAPAVLRILQQLGPTFAFEIVTALKKDSTRITHQDRAKLLKICQEIPNDKLIITHGTDTLLETAAFLHSLPGKTLVMTGAFRPERFRDSDAPIQVGMAIAAVQCLPHGVYVAMQGWVLPWNQITRHPETGFFIPAAS